VRSAALWPPGDKERFCHEPVAKPLLASAALCAATLLPARAEIDVARLKTAIEVLVEGDYPKLDALYKDIHAHPEIAFQEEKTAAKLAADLFGVPVLRENIQDRVENATRFVMLASDDAPRTGHDKTTLAFAVHESRGALRRVLEIFDEAGVNLTRIESRPSRRRVWDYVFLADLEGHREDPHIVAALATLADRCPMLKVLGSYPRGDSPPTATKS